MTKDELIELAQVGMGINSPNSPEYIVCEALIKALAQPKQEPVTLDVSGLTGSTLIPANWKSCAPIESPPPQRKEPEQERFLVATIGNWGRVEWVDGVFPSIGDKMYSAPPKWIGLTFDERLELAQDVDWPAGAYCEYAEKIEAKLKEKNT